MIGSGCAAACRLLHAIAVARILPRVPPLTAPPPHGAHVGADGAIVRGILVFASAAGAGIGAACAWILARKIDPIGGPDWAFAVLVLSLTVIPVMGVLAGISLLRGYTAKRTAIVALAANAIAVLLGAASLLPR